MWDALSLGLSLVVAVVSLPVVVFAIEVLAARAPSGGPGSYAGRASRALGSAAVVVPAHDESRGILPTLADLMPQLGPDDRLIVVADNCSDDTAVVAAAAGAEVIRRDDLTRIGKGYALAYAIDHLAASPPGFVLFIDADCRVSAGAVAELRAACAATGRPVQAAYLMKAPPHSAVDHRFAEFAWIVKNWVRPLGLKCLGCPVQLMGTGMMVGWDEIRAVPLSSGHLVEDLKLGLDLATIGAPPLFLPGVTVMSEFPASAAGVETQRQRWVNGHLVMIVQALPRLLWRALADRNLGLLALALDLSVPPLSLLAALVAVTLMVSGMGAVLGASPLVPALAALDLVLLALALWVAWQGFGRDALAPTAGFGAIVPLMLAKGRLYGRLLLGKTPRRWIRTDRGR